MSLNSFKKSPLLPPPRKQFTEKAKERFLAAFDAHYGVRGKAEVKSRMAGWAKGFIVAGAFVAVMMSVSAYADTANVPADSPLYPLKRLSENVRLALTPTDDQAQLEATLAVRRANEIQDLATRKPSSTLIAGLSADFVNDVSSSLGHVESESATSSETVSGQHFDMGTSATLNANSDCNQVTSIVLRSAQATFELSNNPTLLKRLQDRCGTDAGETVVASGSVNVVASTTIIILPKNIRNGTGTRIFQHGTIILPPIKPPRYQSSSNSDFDPGSGSGSSSGKVKVDLSGNSDIVVP